MTEPTASTIEEKKKQDTDAAKSILSELSSSDFSFRAFRIGRVGDRPRPIKIILDDHRLALHLLKNKCSKEDIRISADMTIAQRNFLKQLRTQLEQRKSHGETNLTICNVQGVPKIVSTDDSRRKN
ncbi:hypothetical protein JTB14_001876 [Gonioctena quinquepunctata]|nr:hypothetical protein JTB14_001876 [Gonioctena quinquepunctata]